MTSKSHGKSFEKYFNSVQDGLCQWQLPFAKANTLPTKRYVSENYLSLARILPWTYSIYFRNWDPTNGSTSIHDVIKIQRLINAGFVMISHLMRDDNIPLDFLDDSIKIFLSSWDEVENAIDDLVSNSMWTKGNHLSLLNLIDQMRRFGNLRLMWEGNNEQVIQQCKKIHPQLRLTQSYFLGKMNKHLDEKCIGIIHNHLIEAGELRNHHQDNKKKEYQRFQPARIEEIISKGFVLSCVLLKDDASNSVYAVECFRRDGVESLRRIEVTSIGTVKSIGMIYTGFQLTEDVIEIEREKMDERVLCPCLLLPLAVRNAEFKKQFTIVTDSWKILREDGTIDYPIHCRNLFSH
jgi:hypothetical protein